MSQAESNLKWTFDKQTGLEEGANDALAQNFKARPYASLLRESVQNALDVPAGNEPVTVRFSFGKINSRTFPAFFELKDHIQGCIDYWHNSDATVAMYEQMKTCFTDEYSSQLCYLKISDRNTRGMDYQPNDNNTPFYAFVRAAKVSVKGHGNTGGTYGFGKAAYFQLSPIRTLLVSTMTTYGRHFFEGESVLCTHYFGGEKKTSVGYYDNNGGRGPISNVNDIPTRFRRDEPGTDFYILGFPSNKKEEMLKEMKEESLRSFFVAIHRKKLVIELERSSSECEVIDSESLPKFMETVFPEAEDNSSQMRTLNPRPYYDAVVNDGKGGRYRTFEEMKSNIGRVFLYTKKTKGASDKILFMRRPYMTVFAKNLQTSIGLSAVFICDDLSGDNKLKKIENSSHTEWKPENDKNPLTQETVEEGKKSFNEVKEFYSDCIKELRAAGDEQELDITGLDDLLYVPDSLVDEDDIERSLGEPSGEVKDNGLSLTTDSSSEFEEKHETGDAANAIVFGEQAGGIVLSNKGNTFAGVEQSGKAGSGGGNHKPGTDVKPADKTDSDGSSLLPIKVICRSFAQCEGGLWWHYITIHTPASIHNGFMDIIVCGEVGDVAVNIAETDRWSFSRNRIFGIELPVGVSRIKVRFSDNMKYTLKTDLHYE